MPSRPAPHPSPRRPLPQRLPARLAGRAAVALAVSVACAAVAVAAPPRPPAPSAAGRKPLSLEAIFGEKPLFAPMPRQLRWSPSGDRLAYILSSEDGKERNLWIQDAHSGERRILIGDHALRSLQPTAREAAKGSERERERLLRYAVASWLWAPDGGSILFLSAGRLYRRFLDDGRTVEIAPEHDAVRDPKFSPDGRWIGFVSRHDLWVAPSEGGKAVRLTRGGNSDLLHGDLDWVYPEEFGIRSGWAWSPDSSHIAFLELDESPVPTYPIVDLVDTSTAVDVQRYPKAGDPNPRVRAGILAVEAEEEGPGPAASRPVWIDRAAEYIPRFAWAPDGRLAVELLDRAQSELELILVDSATGHSHTVLIERDPYWVNVTDDLRFLAGGAELLWSSERTGYSHLYHYDADGTLLATLTKGEWEVQSIAGVDEKGGWVYYLSNEANTLGNDLYRVRLDGTGKERLTEPGGMRSVSLAPDAQAYAMTQSSLHSPPRFELVDLFAGARYPLEAKHPVMDFARVEPELFTVDAPGGGLVRGMLLRPPKIEPGAKLPLLIYIYGGPHAPTIRDAWGRDRDLWHQYLVQQGLVVAQIDDRASSIPGHRQEATLSRNYGPVAFQDLMVGLDHLTSLDLVDPNRVAVWGWSGGGFSTCFALTHTDRFRAGIAVAPVTDWHLYDSIYTERYMGLPQDEPEAYARTSAVKAAADLHGRLLLVHGDTDDNVHLQNTIQLAHALVDAGKTFAMQIYPRKTHSIHGKGTRLHLFRTMTEFLERELEFGGGE